MIDMTNGVQTRDGRQVRIYATNGGDPYVLHGAFRNPDGQWHVVSWDAQGRHYASGLTSSLDLVSPPIERTLDLYVFSDGSSRDYDGRPSTYAQARIQVPVKYRVGEGL